MGLKDGFILFLEEGGTIDELKRPVVKRNQFIDEISVDVGGRIMRCPIDIWHFVGFHSIAFYFIRV